MSSALVPRPIMLPDSAQGRSALAELSRGVVTTATASDVLELPANCSAVLVAFSARALDHPDALNGISEGSYRSLSELPASARIVQQSGGRIRLRSDERVAIWCGGDVSAAALKDLLVALDDRTVFLKIVSGDSPNVLASLLADHPQLVGLSADFLVDAPEDPYDALSGLEHLQSVGAVCSQIDPIDDSWKQCNFTHTARTLRRVGTLTELRGLGLVLARADDLAPLDALAKLRNLWLMLEKESGDWRPQLPELRTLAVAPFGRSQPRWMPDLSGCPQLESLRVDREGNADAILDEAAALPRLRQLDIAGLDRTWLSAASIDRLASLVRLRRLSLSESSRLEVPNGLLRRLETLTVLETFSADVVGATAADVRWLSARLPSTRLMLRLTDATPSAETPCRVRHENGQLP